MVFACTSSAFASSASIENTSLDFMQSEEYVQLSNQVLDLYKAGNEVEANNLPGVIELKKMMESNPSLAAEYISSLQAMKAMQKGTANISLNGDETKIIPFDDGSFIKASSKTTASKEIDSDSILRDPPGSIYHATEDFDIVVMGAYPVAFLHLITDYDYGNYTVNITDVNCDSTILAPAWLVSQTPTRVSATKSKGVFVYQDPFGSSTNTLITTITPGAYYVTISNTDY